MIPKLRCVREECPDKKGGNCTYWTNINRRVVTFLNESNKIESVYDEVSLMQALYAWEYIMSEKEITSSVILKTHKILMLHQNLFGYEKGYFRQVPVWVGGREGKPWYVIPELIANWVKKLPLWTTTEDIKKAHVDFEKIHPFVDGNGRTGRILMNWHLLKIGKPVMIIREDRKEQYYEWFK